jgi:LDH2 family malate/lactate/ureidoglycolate dehydrogenase
MRIETKVLQEKIEVTLSQTFKADEARKIAAYFVWAEMSGNKTQGIAKMIGSGAIQNFPPKHEILIERDTKLSQLINAGAYPAPLVCQWATETLISTAKEHGFAIVGVHNTFSSNGAQAYYAEQIARENLIGIVASSSPACVAPFDSIDPLFGTNPIGFSFPTNEDPMVFDMATSAMAFYGLIVAKAKGEPIPDNIAIDEHGNPTTDPIAAMKGAILPFDRGYKGSGLGLIVEMLGGPLVSAAYATTSLADEWGSVFIAIDPELLVDIAQFKSNCSDLIRKIKTSRPKTGSTQIRLPGEQSKKAYAKALESGYVDIDDGLLESLGYK